MRWPMLALAALALLAGLWPAPLMNALDAIVRPLL